MVDKPSAFSDFYERAAAFSFKDDADRPGVFAGFLGARGIFDKKMVFLVTGKLDDNVMAFCEELNKNDTEAFVYVADAALEEPVLSSPMIHTHVYTMPAHGNLTELM